MKLLFAMLALGMSVTLRAADDVDPPTPAAPASKPPLVSHLQPAPSEASKPSAADAGEPARFVTDAKWDLAGYNLTEVIYTILVTSHDSRILRCTTQLSGSYYEDGKKLSISDRQSSTVFPEQQVQVGNWMGMDEKSGTTYSVKCHAI